MPIIAPRFHGLLDYAVALTLVTAPIALDFGSISLAAFVIPLVAGLGLAGYSLVTDYSAGVRRLLPWRVHLALDAIAGVCLVMAPFAFGFGGLPRGFLIAVGVADLLVVALSDRMAESTGSDLVGER